LRGGTEYALEDKNTIVQTFDSFMVKLLLEHNITPATANDMPANLRFREQHNRRVRQCLEIAGRYADRFEAIFIDEGQDCSAEEVLLYRKLGKLCFVAADSKQSIYTGAAGLLEWKRSIGAEHQTHLQYHYRNGKAICLLADLIARPSAGEDKMLPSMRYDEEEAQSTVVPANAVSLDEQIRKVIGLLQTQLKMYPNEMIGIITPRQWILTQISQALKQSPYSDMCTFQKGADEGTPYIEFSEGKRIFVCTVHSSKGLEAGALHIVGAETFNEIPNLQTNLMYTGVTRAKTSLTIHHTGDLPPLLNDALRAIQGETRKVTLSDVFGVQDDVV